ncbi:MAG: beta-ketoacyl-ACP synthase II [Actinomycetia bacterium]|nr:beta-ketoacyl-ACP synthase II [Actinomycetes bacterium]
MVTREASNHTRRVVVTGIGMVTPLGTDRETSWQGLIEGRSGAGPITLFDASDLPVRFGCEVPDFDPTVVLERKTVRRTDRYTHLAVAAAREAAADAGLELSSYTQPQRVGVAVATGMGGLQTLLEGARTMDSDGPDRVSPFALPALIPNMASAWVSIELGAMGPVSAACTACAASTMGIADATLYLRNNLADVMIAGGSEAVINPLAITGFAAARALSQRNDDPRRASRPFDSDRDGLVMGEGASVLVLEELEHAQARRARIYAELLGFGLSADAEHITASDPTGKSPARAIGLALDDAGVSPHDIGYINAHATSTPVGDTAETNVIRLVFGDEGARSTPISSTKSMTGHMFGAAGATEAAICVLAMSYGLLPPTINHESPDPDCGLDYIPNDVRPANVTHSLTTSFAFGGHNAALVFHRWDGPEGRRTGKHHDGS